MLQGLYHRLAGMERNHEKLMKTARDGEPAAQWEAAQRSLTVERNGARLIEHIADNLKLIDAVEEIIRSMQAMDAPKSADRTLAMRDLESASMRLRRELGDKPLAEN